MFLNLFHTPVALYVSGHSAILRCFAIVVESAALLYAVMLRVHKLLIRSIISPMSRIRCGMFSGTAGEKG
jgi:hypothetical protein